MAISTDVKPSEHVKTVETYAPLQELRYHMKIHVSSIPKVKPKLKNLVHFLVCGCSNSSTRFERPPTPTRHRCDFFALEPQFVANGCPANTCGQKQWPCLHGHCNRWCFLELDLCVSTALQKHVQASTCNAMVWAVLRELNGFLSFTPPPRTNFALNCSRA